MPYFQRSLASASAVFVLLIALFALPETVSAKRCPMRMPDSLLTLYLRSDLVVVASIKSEKTLKMIDENEYGTSFDVEKVLDISETLKGWKLDSAAFKIIKYKPKSSENTNFISEEAEVYANVGDKALFFLVKDKENDSYRLADGSSAIKILEDYDLEVYIKRIKELKQIQATKRNQLAKLTEWLVRLVEESATRAEGTADLQASFSALEREREEQDENADEKKKVFVKEPVLSDKNFRAESASDIAKLLTDSQKQRISNVLLVAINADLVKFNNAESEEEIAPDYSLINLVDNWDKTTFAMNSFALLQNTDNSNRRKVSYLMNVAAASLDDEELYSISNEYESALSEEDSAETDYSDEEEVFEPEIMADSDTAFESETATEAQETETQETKSVDEQVVDVITVENESEDSSEAVEKAVTKITYKEYREKLLSKFIKQYGIAISQTSAAD